MNKVADKQKSPEIRVRVTVILKRKDGKICFVRHNKNGKVYWLLPGGGQDPFESAVDAAKRELFEELRLEVENFKLAFVRESFAKDISRHIQFLVFEGLEVDLSRISLGEDERVEGFDFFDSDEIARKTIYPTIKDDLIAYLNHENIALFKTLEWIP